MASEGVKRKLTTILAADVEGYSRLMSDDEEATLKTLKTYREIIGGLFAKHEGRLVGSAGDAVLADFGSAVEAVRCAISIQEDLAVRNAELAKDRRMRFRIGINVGDVMVDGDDLFGDGVNVAARLEGLAAPGGICVSGSVFEQVKQKLSLGFEDMGPQVVKNIPEPVSVYRVQIDENAAALTTPLARASASRRRIVVRAGLAAAGVVVLLAGGAGLWSWRFGAEPPETTAQSTAPDTRRIAVLPFANMSPDAKDEYFSDGLTEELITRLSKIGELRVIARTSIMKYKDANKGIAEIGRELGVGTILEGSVRRADDQVRITVQLIDVASEEHLWAEDYDRDFKDIFAIQSAIAEEVAGSLKITLLEPEQQRIETPDTKNIEAYELYIEANYRARHASAENSPKVLELLKKAIELDPNYAAAYAALADFSLSIFWYEDVSVVELRRQAKEYAEKALALDEAQARAHLALARIKLAAWDWDGAEADYQRSIELNPSDAHARTMYGHQLLMAVRRQDDEALEQIEQALALDPLDRGPLDAMGWLRHHRREYDQSIAVLRKMKDLYPGDPGSSIGIGQGLVFKGRHDEGIEEIKKAVEGSPDYLFLRGFLAWAYGMSGRLDEAKKVVEELKAVAETKFISPMAFAWAYTGMGDKNNAITAFEKAYEERDGAIIYIRVLEFYDVLSSEPRYLAILKNMGLES